jgi:hypothetical protein
MDVSAATATDDRTKMDTSHVIGMEILPDSCMFDSCIREECVNVTISWIIVKNT